MMMINPAAAQADPRILLDWSQPFDDFKVQVLENVVHVMYKGFGQNVSHSFLDNNSFKAITSK